MARMIPLMDEKRRDAQVAAQWPAKLKPYQLVAPGGGRVRLERIIRATGETSYEGLRRSLGDDVAIARALAERDPEIDLALTGKRLGEAARVYLRKDGTIVAAARMLTVVRGPDGAERSRSDFVDVEASVKEDGPAIAWAGRLVPREDAIRRFAFTRQLQLTHVSGLTFEFLYEMAKRLDEAKSLSLLGAGPKGVAPLVFSTNGAPYRGFLEGRVDGPRYRLVLHLSNLELKTPEQEVKP